MIPSSKPRNSNRKNLYVYSYGKRGGLESPSVTKFGASLTNLIQSVDDDGDYRIVIVTVRAILRGNSPNGRRTSWRLRGLVVDDRILKRRVCGRHELQEHGNLVAIGLRRDRNALGAGRSSHRNILPTAGEDNSAPSRCGETTEGDALDEGGMRLNGDDGVLVDVNSNVEGVVRELGSEGAVVLDEPEGREGFIDELKPLDERLKCAFIFRFILST